MASHLAARVGGAGTTVGLIFLPFIVAIILGFGDAEYQGPAGAPAAAV
jgi:hypothetical protein